MDNAEAASIIDKMIECTYNEGCDGHCEKCQLHSSNEDQIKALTIAFKALKKES